MKKIKIIAVIMFVVMTVVTMTACWDQVELDSIAIITGVGLDAAEDEDIELVLQVANISLMASAAGGGGGGGGNEKPFTLYDMTAPTFMSAMGDIKTKFSRSPFLHHNQMTVIGRELAEQGIKKHFDAMLRQDDMRLEVFLVIADGSAKDFLGAEVGPEKISTFSLNKLLRVAEKHCPFLAPRFFDFLTEFVHPTCCLVLPIVKVEKNSDGTEQFNYTKMAVLKNLKMVSEMDQQLIRGYTWIRGKMEDRDIRVTTEQDYADFNLEDIKSKVDIIFENGEPVVDIKIKCKAVITGLQGYMKAEQCELLDYFEKQIQNTIEEEVVNVIKYSQEIGCDIFCWGKSIYQHYPKKWKPMKDNWEEIFKNIKYKLEIKPDISSSRNILGGILKESHDR